MGLFGMLFRGADINAVLNDARNTEGAVILDVRDADEFAAGHIPGALSLPLDRIQEIGAVVSSKDTPIFAYCLTGMRSGRAVTALRNAGYTNVKNIGGINRYRGPIERG